MYQDDPKNSPSAKPIKDLSWAEFFRLFGERFDSPEHKPGAHVPVDMLAAKLASENGISCFLTNGRDASVMGNILQGKKPEGTYIHQ